jgi:hypothetical protein
MMGANIASSGQRDKTDRQAKSKAITSKEQIPCIPVKKKHYNDSAVVRRVTTSGVHKMLMKAKLRIIDNAWSK